ncbi:hypothetical protein [Janthinobacterium sp. RB2R34]|uniref:hypothetical protein n=1 Tax=Janthinobacterium sp. RB2R34 TaxID=3424193 RepID=UPI003F27A6C8
MSTHSLISKKRIYSLNPFGSRRDFLIWLCIVLAGSGIVAFATSFFAADQGSTMGALFGGGAAVVFMRVMMIPIIGIAEDGNLRSLNDKMVSLGYNQDYLDSDGRRIVSRNVPSWARWDAEKITIQKSDNTTLIIIGPLAVMRKL